MPAWLSSIRRKKDHYPCLFYVSISLFLIGISLIVVAIIVNSDAEQHKGWLPFGCIAGSVFIIFGFGFSLIFWHFGKERIERHVLDYDTANESKRVPKAIEQKMEEAKRINKEREAAHSKQAELERKMTMQSNRTVQTMLPGSRVTSQESGNHDPAFQFQSIPEYQGEYINHNGQGGHDNYSFTH